MKDLFVQCSLAHEWSTSYVHEWIASPYHPTVRFHSYRFAFFIIFSQLPSHRDDPATAATSSSTRATRPCGSRKRWPSNSTKKMYSKAAAPARLGRLLMLVRFRPPRRKHESTSARAPGLRCGTVKERRDLVPDRNAASSSWSFFFVSSILDKELVDDALVVVTVAVLASVFVADVVVKAAAPPTSTPFRSTKNRVVLSSRSSMLRARTPRPSCSAATAELMAALSPVVSASASWAARLVLLTSTVSMPRSQDPMNTVHCPKACGWLYTRRTCDIGCEGQDSVVVSPRCSAASPLPPPSPSTPDSWAQALSVEIDVGAADDMSVRGAEEEGGWWCGADGSGAMWPTRQWCTSRYISRQTFKSVYRFDLSAKLSSVKTTDPFVEFSNGTTP